MAFLGKILELTDARQQFFRWASRKSCRFGQLSQRAGVINATHLTGSFTSLIPKRISHVSLDQTIGLLLVSNMFMTAAWYGHLRFKEYSLIAVIAVSWLIALPEYIFQVPANRIGHNGGISAPQLKMCKK